MSHICTSCYDLRAEWEPVSDTDDRLCCYECGQLRIEPRVWIDDDWPTDINGSYLNWDDRVVYGYRDGTIYEFYPDGECCLRIQSYCFDYGWRVPTREVELIGPSQGKLGLTRREYEAAYRARMEG